MTFSINNSNNDSMLETNKGLYRAIKAYNENSILVLEWMIYQVIPKM